MKDSVEHPFKYKHYPFYLASIVVFFLTNGYSQYVNRIHVPDMLLFGFAWTLIAYSVFYLLKPRLGSVEKAGIFAAYLLICYLFFGDIHAGFEHVPVLNRFRGVLPLTVLVGIVLLVYLKKTRQSLSTLTSYLNLVFALLILTDIFRIVTAPEDPEIKPRTIVPLLSGSKDKKPDIYLIILDEYAGNATLKRHFGFDNKVFLDALKDRSFFVARNPVSNYSSTAVSAASVFQMNFIPWSTKKSVSLKDNNDAELEMGNSSLLSFLASQHYDFHNFSIFNIGPQRTKFPIDLIPIQMKLITTKIFHNQLKKHLQMTLEHAEGRNFDRLAGWFQETYRSGITRLSDLALNTAAGSSGNPRFVYLHLLMPHWPYLNDSLGRKPSYNAFRLIDNNADRRHYLGYLKYTNQYILRIVDELKRKTNNEAVIVLMSDHGYRKMGDEFFGSSNSNLNATFLPGKNYDQFYDSVSNVNQFRVILNTIFKTRLPLLKDSIVNYPKLR